MSDSVRALLTVYQPADPTETRDVARVRALVAQGDPWPRSTPLHVTGSALIVHPPSRRVLLRWHQRQQAWLQVGGHGDPGEVDPLVVAVREGREETGLEDVEPWPDSSIVHVVVVPVPATPHESAHEHADIRFVLATHQPEAARPENPAAELRWLGIDDSIQQTEEENLRETLQRVRRLFDAAQVGR